MTTSCKEGYGGNACAFCLEGFFRLGDYCRKCIPLWGRILVVLFAIAVLFFALWKLSQMQNRIPFTFKIAFHWIQFIGLYLQLSEKWPSALKSLYNITNALSFDIQYFGMTCEQVFSFWTVWVIKLLSPLVFLFLMLLVFYVRLRKSVQALKFSMVVKHKMSIILYTMTFFSTIIYSSLFQIFNCTQQGHEFVLAHDPSIRCYTTQWKIYLGVDIFFIMLYVPLPLISGLYYFVSKAHLVKRGHLGLDVFIKPYREGCEYWEMVRLFYKLVFVLIRDISSIDGSNKTLLLLIVIVSSAHLDIMMKPYRAVLSGQVSLK
jgi:hypothetical protein